MKEQSLPSVLRIFFKSTLVKFKSTWANFKKMILDMSDVIPKKNMAQNAIGIMVDNSIENEIITEIEYSLLEIEIARNIFNNVDESRLIDAAIYLEEASMRRLDYLFSLAKKKCISVSNEYIARKFLEFTEERNLG